MQVASFQFQLHGVSVRVSAQAAHLHESLAYLDFDFKSFPRSSDFCPQIDINLVEQLAPSAPLPMLIFSNRKVRIFGWWNRRVCLFSDGVWGESCEIGSQRHFKVGGKNSKAVAERVYNIILSALGEKLDLLGLHRVHSLGARFGQESFILLAGSGVGKSSLGYLLSKKNPGDLYSDESPLLSRQSVSSFPTRFALIPEVAKKIGITSQRFWQRSGKLLFSFPAPAPPEAQLKYLWLGRLGSGPAQVRPVQRIRSLPTLFGYFVIGLGLAQMAEWMLRGCAIWRLIQIFFLRLKCLTQVLMHLDRIYLFEMSKNPQLNLETIESFFVDHDPPDHSPTVEEPRLQREAKEPTSVFSKALSYSRSRFAAS